MLTLLVADSNIQTCEEIRDYCSHYNNIRVVNCVYNGKDALLALQVEPVDALLLDLVLPVLDGLSILNTLQAMEESKRPAVFVHTAFLDNRLLQELQRLHVLFCFVKPIGPEHIIPRIIQLMRISVEGSTFNESDLMAFEQKQSFDADIGNEITRQIRAVGIPAHLHGYHYLRAAIKYSVEAADPSAVAVTKDIYPFIAKEYNTRPSLVERSIRNAIEVAWTRGNTQILHQYFGYTIDDYKGKPTNAEFIAMIADRVRMYKKY